MNKVRAMGALSGASCSVRRNQGSITTAAIAKRKVAKRKTGIAAVRGFESAT